MDFIKRIGTAKHKYKMEFFIKKVTFNKNLNGTVYISIKRGDHKANSQQQVPFQDKVCNFKNQVLSFPAVTLFYNEQQKKYLEKLGQIKVIMKTNKGQKKLLGIVPFDVASYVNDQKTKSFKQKKQLQQTPQNLTGHISFQLFIEYLGQASETSKSIAKQEKKTAREQSPFNKIASFFGMNSNEDQNNSKRTPVSPPRGHQSSQKNSEIRSKKQKKQKTTQQQDYEEQSNRRGDRKQKRNKQAEQQYQNQQEQVRPVKNRQKQKNKNKSDQQSELFNYNPPQNIKNSSKKEKEKKKKKRQQQVQQVYNGGYEDKKKQDSPQQNTRKRQKIKNEIQQNQESNQANKPKNAPPKQHKNILPQKYHQTLTQLSEQDREKSNLAKSDVKIPITEKRQFFFDDPNTFPDHYKKKQKPKNQQKDFQNTQSEKINQTKKSKQPEQPREIKRGQKDRNQKKDITNESSKGSSRKIKQNTINVDAKNIKANLQNNKAQNQRLGDIFGVDKYKQKNKEKVSQRQVNMIKKSSQTNKNLANQPSNNKQFGKNNILSQFAVQQNKIQSKYIAELQKKSQMEKEQLAKLLKNNARSQQLQKSRALQIQKLKKDLQQKTKQLQEHKYKLQSLEQLKKKLKESDDRKKQLQKMNEDLKERTTKMEKQVGKLKYQNQNLKGQSSKNESFFRQTEQHYIQKNNDSDLQQELKKLQRQKNEFMLNLQKQKQKNKKQVKLLTQQIQKQKLKFKQYQDLSKAELKKIKDQSMNKNGSIQTLKDKLKQKSKEQQTLLNQNKLMNSQNIDLKQKLANIKIKICYKLNQANQTGQTDLMEILTQLNEQL